MATEPTLKIEKQEEKYLLIIQTPEDTIIHPFVPIPAGSFLRRDGATVSVNAFYMAQFSLTQEAYEVIMGQNYSHFKGKQNPIEFISWYDSIEFCEILNKKIKIISPFYTINKDKKDMKPYPSIWTVNFNTNGKGFRLPTEAEWEYASRANSNTKFAGSEVLEHVGWFEKNNEYGTKPVGLKFPNQFGLFDMSGNVWEWCWDWYDIYDTNKRDNPIGAEKSQHRIGRGGSWILNASFNITTSRDHWRCGYRSRNIGCRLAFVP